MAVVLAIANFLVLLPLGEWLTWAAFAYPIAFLVCDCVNRIAGAACARRVVNVGFLVGVPLSFVVSWQAGSDGGTALRIALASGTAYFLSQYLDVSLFDRLRHRARAAWWMPPLLSSTPAATLDTLLFFGLAFGGTSIPWLQLAAGDLAVKLGMALALLPPYRLFVLRLAPAS